MYYALRLLEEAGPNTELGWMLAVLLGFFLLIIIVGWLTRDLKARQDGADEVAQTHHDSHDTH